jgi:hypothetical protein
MDATLQSFLETEELTSRPVSNVDQLREGHSVCHTSRSGDGGFEVGLSFRPDVTQLVNYLEQSERRLAQLQRRFKKQPNFKHEYSKFINEYLEHCHMVEVKPSITSHMEYFLPYHCVFIESLELSLMVMWRLQVVYHSIQFFLHILLPNLICYLYS